MVIKRLPALSLGLFGLLVVMGLNIIISDNAIGVETEIECRPLKFIYARGSGQTLDASNEVKKFKDGLKSVLPGSMYNIYELGTTPQNGYSYPAVNVSGLRNGNAIGAKISGGMGNDYGSSVSNGVLELKNYLESTHSTCLSTLFVLGGYSQGAQVIGQTLPILSDEIKSKIVFSGLFGDPKLNLPEGWGFNPPACRGENLSVYRRDIANCTVDNGSLGARRPYLPASLESKTGLWCYANDFVCGSSKNPFNTSGHGTYGNDGMAIDKAVAEAVSRLRTALPKDVADTIPRPDPTTSDSTVDIVYIIDTTGSMSGQITSAKQFAANSAAGIMAKNGRAALVAYKDKGDSYTAKVVSGLSSDIHEFQNGLSTLEASGGGDEPEALLHALMTAFNGLDWKNGATKAAVILTDASFHDPDLVDNTTLAGVVKRSLEIDPVNIYPLVPSFLSSSYEALANQTAGQVIVDNGDTVAALSTALSKIKTRPVVTLPLESYMSEINQPITFSATVSKSDDVTISSYDWDFDGDGTFDEITTSPTTKHAYPAAFDGLMQIRVTASNGTVASASAKVLVGALVQSAPEPASPPSVTVSVLDTKDHKSRIKVAWTSPAVLPHHYVLTLNGIGLGTLTTDRTSVEIDDVGRGIDNEIGIIGSAADNTEGSGTFTVLQKEQSSIPTTPPPTSPVKSLALSLLQCLKKIITLFVTRR